MWIDVNIELPDMGESVLVKCPRMGENAETIIMVAQIMSENDWYSFFPYDQPIEPTHWCYSMVCRD